MRIVIINQHIRCLRQIGTREFRIVIHDDLIVAVLIVFGLRDHRNAGAPVKGHTVRQRTLVGRAGPAVFVKVFEIKFGGRIGDLPLDRNICRKDRRCSVIIDRRNLDDRIAHRAFQLVCGIGAVIQNRRVGTVVIEAGQLLLRNLRSVLFDRDKIRNDADVVARRGERDRRKIFVQRHGELRVAREYGRGVAVGTVCFRILCKVTSVRLCSEDLPRFADHLYFAARKVGVVKVQSLDAHIAVSVYLDIFALRRFSIFRSAPAAVIHSVYGVGTVGVVSEIGRVQILYNARVDGGKAVLPDGKLTVERRMLVSAPQNDLRILVQRRNELTGYTAETSENRIRNARMRRDKDRLVGFCRRDFR